MTTTFYYWFFPCPDSLPIEGLVSAEDQEQALAFLRVKYFEYGGGRFELKPCWGWCDE